MAIRTVSKIIPAQPEQTKLIDLTICDLCGNPEAKNQPLVYECTVCARTVCKSCSHYVTDRYGLHEAVLCSRCYASRDQYTAEIKKLDTDHEAAGMAIMDKWRRESE